MGLDFQYMDFNPSMLSNHLSIRMTPLYHLILRDIAFKKTNGFIASKLRDKVIKIKGGEDVYAVDYAFDETDYVYLSKTDIKGDDLQIRDETIYIKKEAGEKIENQKLIKDDIVISRSGTIGITILITKNNLPENKIVIPSGYVKVLKVDNEKLLPEFIKYYFNTPQLRQLMEIGATGKNQKNLSHEAVLDLPIPEITPTQQQKIIDKINKIWREIINLRGKIKTATEICDTAFSKCLKINSDIKIKFYENEIKLNQLREDRFIRTDPDYFYFYDIYKKFLKENNDIEFIEINEIMDSYKSGSSIKRKDYANAPTGNIHLVPRDVKDCRMLVEEPIYLVVPKAQELKDYKCKEGDVILVLSSNVGDCFVFKQKDDIQYTLSHYMAKLKIKDINPYYLVYYLNISPLRAYFRAIETGKDQKNLAQYYIFHLKLPILEEQEEIVKEIKENLKENLENKKKIQELKDEINTLLWSELHKISEKQRKINQ